MDRRGLNQSQLAAYLEVHPSSVNAWVKGTSEPSPSSCAKLADLFHEPLAKVYALAGHPSPDYVPSAREPVMLRDQVTEFVVHLPNDVPIYEAFAGAGAGQVVDVTWFPPDTRGRRLAGLYVRGRSMEPDLFPGDIVIVDEDREPKPGDIVVATIGDETYVKRYERRSGFPVLVGNDGSSLNAREATIHGVAVERRQKLARQG